MMNWEWLISATVLIVLGLGFWAKISKQTIAELIADIIDRLKGTSEDSVDYATEIYD